MPPPTLTHLRVNHLLDPRGIDTRRPRFSWWVEGDAPPSAWRVQVADAEAPATLAWDSGWRDEPAPALVPYQGRSLRSRDRMRWRVRVRDAAGRQSAWSEPAHFEMGLLRASDWTARWIHDPRRRVGVTGGASRFRTSLVVEAGKPLRARLYVSALGVVDAYINGARAGPDRLAPGWTDYAVRTRYRVHDVTHLLASGANTLGAVLADGWYAGQVAWVGTGVYGRHPSLLMQLEVTHADGSHSVTATSDAWTVAPDSRWLADLLAGEGEDLRLDAGWESAAAGWHSAALTPGVRTRLVAAAAPPVADLEQPDALRLTRHGSEVRADIGENIAGVPRVRLSGPSGATLTLRHAEMLDESGSLYTANLRGADATDTVTLDGRPLQWSPRFTTHGFRYIEASPRAGCAVEAVGAVVVASDLATAGGFACSDPRLTRLHGNVVRGLRGNTVGLPTDCPQRDERLGWLCDAQLIAPTMLYLLDGAAFLGQWMQDVVDARSSRGGFPDMAPRVRTRVDGRRWPDGAPGWADAAVIIPWLLYRHCGDLDVADRHFAALDRWVRLLHGANPGGRRLRRRGHDYGDWLAVGESTSRDLIADAYWALSTGLVARLARLLGHRRRAEEMDRLHEVVRDTFRTTHVGESGVVGDGTQTAQVLALAFGLLDASSARAAAAHLAASIEEAGWHLRTGFLGTPHLLGVLRDHGHADVAYKLLLQTSHPSWLYQVEHGATTMWERWDSWTAENGFQTPFMNSFNHVALGSVATFLHETVGGIALDADEPAYRRVRIAPMPGGGITEASTWHDSPQGRVSCSWRLGEGRFVCTVGVPASARASVHLPGSVAAPLDVGPGTHQLSVVVAPSG
ncbi:MAG: family 78 glycoside hydrolase catalytic domain [Candidatus Dormibacteria bacterium]